MKKKIQKPRSKPFFCHDENLEFYSLRKSCAGRALFQSFVKLMKKQGTKDPKAISECNKNDKHIITHNTKDFQNPISKIKIGIVCIGLKSESNWPPKFLKLLKHYPKHENYYYKNMLIDNSITIKDRRTKEVNII